MQSVDLTGNDSDIEEMQDMKLESNAMDEDQSVITWIGKHKFIIHPKKIPKKISPCKSPKSSCKNNEPRWINTKDKSIKWRGIDRGDGKYRLYKTVPHHVPDMIRRRNHRGRLMYSFDKVKLMKIAWKIGVSNPDGFNKKSELNSNRGIQHFIDGWTRTNKPALMSYIWNHLANNNKILTL